MTQEHKRRTKREIVETIYILEEAANVREWQLDENARTIARLQSELAQARAELAERDASWELRHQSDMRAIAMWQAATGEALHWPSHDDLCVWLMEQLAQAQQWRNVWKATAKAKWLHWRSVSRSLAHSAETVNILCEQVEDDSTTINRLYIEAEEARRQLAQAQAERDNLATAIERATQLNRTQEIEIIALREELRECRTRLSGTEAAWEEIEAMMMLRESEGDDE